MYVGGKCRILMDRQRARQTQSFPDITELKLLLPFWVIEGRMCRCKAVRLAELPFL